VILAWSDRPLLRTAVDSVLGQAGVEPLVS
jgi:hypothetical protein